MTTDTYKFAMRYTEKLRLEYEHVFGKVGRLVVFKRSINYLPKYHQVPDLQRGLSCQLGFLSSLLSSHVLRI